MINRCLSPLLVLSFAALSLAQQAPPLPPGPLIQKYAPVSSAWVVTQESGVLGAVDKPTPSTSGDAKKEGSSQTVSKMEIIKSGKLRLVQKQLSASQSTVVWIMGDLEVHNLADGINCEVLTPSEPGAVPNPYYFDFSSTDFPEFDWISIQNYVATKDYKGIQCIVFKEGADKVAFVDLRTRLPIALQENGQLSLYAWSENPPSLTLPSNVKVLLAAREKAAKQSKQGGLAP